MANFFKNYKKNKELKLTQEEIDEIMNNIVRLKGADNSTHDWDNESKSEAEIELDYRQDYYEGELPDEEI